MKKKKVHQSAIILLCTSFLLLWVQPVSAARGLKRLRKQGRSMSRSSKAGSGKKGKPRYDYSEAETRCNPDCPCCDESIFPEFVAAVTQPGVCSDKDCCYYRHDEQSEVLLATMECNEQDVTGTAFLSFVYGDTSYYGCNTRNTNNIRHHHNNNHYNNNRMPPRRCAVCGDSLFGSPPIVLSRYEADVCQEVLAARVPDLRVCWDETRDGETFLPCRDAPVHEDDCDRASTAAELQNLLTPMRGITKVSLCSTEIQFEQTVTLPRLLELKCAPGHTCVFDGKNERRLFEYEIDTALPPESQYASMIFENLVFQNGNSIDGGGGAIQLVGEAEASRAMFRNCTFQYNDGTINYNGGAIEANPWYSLDIIETTFAHNTAHAGGAIYAVDTRISLFGATFSDNSVCGGSEGPAISLDSTSPTTPPHVSVECMDDKNEFIRNLDGTCLGNDYDQLSPDDIVAPAVLGCDRV